MAGSRIRGREHLSDTGSDDSIALYDRLVRPAPPCIQSIRCRVTDMATATPKAAISPRQKTGYYGDWTGGNSEQLDPEH